MNQTQHACANLRELDCEILVLGAGPAGMSAVNAAATAGLTIILADENPQPGGQIWRGGAALWRDPRSQQLWQGIQASCNVTCLWRARLVFIEAQSAVFEAPAGAIRVRWNKLIIANGGRELLLPFPGWTLPGVMGAGGLQALIKAGMPVRGKRILIAGSGPLLLAAAATAQAAGAEVIAIAEHQSMARLAGFLARLARLAPKKVGQALSLRWQLRASPYLHDARVLAVAAQQTGLRLTLQQAQHQRQVDCDLLACGFGLVPNLEVARQLNCATEVSHGFLRGVVDQLQRSSQAGIWLAGEVCGIGGVEQALVQGRIAGLAAIGQEQAALAASLQRQRRASLAFANLLAQSFKVDSSLKALSQDSTLICRCEDVSKAQLLGFQDWRSAKLQTRLGMGPCQGRVCASACQVLFDWPPADLRPPLFPAKVSTLCALPVHNQQAASQDTGKTL